MKTCDAKSVYGFGLTYMDRFNAWILQNSPAVGSESWLQSISSHVACMTVPRPICSNYVLADCCKSLTAGQVDTFLLFLHSASEGVRPKKKPILSKNSTLWRNVHKFQLAQTVVIHTILIWQTPQAPASNLQAMTPRGLHFVGLGVVIFQFSGLVTCGCEQSLHNQDNASLKSREPYLETTSPEYMSEQIFFRVCCWF